MSTLSTDEIEKLSHNIVHQVAYSFYDRPYILLLKLLITFNVCQEQALADTLGIPRNDLRKYLGKLKDHHLVKSEINKERLAPDERGGGFLRRGAPPRPGDPLPGQPRTKDVTYYWIDYREFANVVKYRLVMMRKDIEEKGQQAVVRRGYICPDPACRKTFDTLEVTDLLDPTTGQFRCDQCGADVVEYDPSIDPSNANAKQDRMSDFNKETRGVQDALKMVEGVTLPSLNIKTWLAINVKSVPLPGEEGAAGEAKRNIQVMIGEEGDEKERIEKARLAESQRTQNALPVWYTHSTVTGSETALGHDVKRRAETSSAAQRRVSDGNRLDPERDLEAHYADLMGDGESEDDEDREEVVKPVVQPSNPFRNSLPDIKTEPGVKVEPGTEEDLSGMYEEEEEPYSTGVTPVPGTGTATASGTPAGDGDAVMVMVAGVLKPFDEVTDEDTDHLMTEEEREAYIEMMG